MVSSIETTWHIFPLNGPHREKVNWFSCKCSIAEEVWFVILEPYILKRQAKHCYWLCGTRIFTWCLFPVCDSSSLDYLAWGEVRNLHLTSFPSIFPGYNVIIYYRCNIKRSMAIGFAKRLTYTCIHLNSMRCLHYQIKNYDRMNFVKSKLLL